MIIYFLNCLSPGHIAHECVQHFKYCVRGPGYCEKCTAALRDWYKLFNTASAWGVFNGKQSSASSVSRCEDRGLPGDNTQKMKALKISDRGDLSKNFLLSTGAVKVINPVTVKSALAYAQQSMKVGQTSIKNALVVPNFCDNASVLLHSVDIVQLGNCCAKQCCAKFKREITDLKYSKQFLCELNLTDEAVETFRN